MVIDGFRDVLALLVVLFASFAAVAGIVVLEGFFRNKLKELFDDVNYFIFFFLAAGYFLYAVGEVSFYLARMVFQDTSPVGIADLYWSGGAFLILVSFLALTIVLFRQNPDKGKLTVMAAVGGAVLLLVLYLIFGVTLAEGERSFFGYYYPLVGALILTFSLSVILFSPQLGNFGTALLIFFFASLGILLGDLFFTYGTAQGTYAVGIVGTVADLFYLLGYGLSLVAFVTLRVRMHAAAFERR